eukprot:9761975-Ditylum_brightwellii.AAC.1
MFRHISDTEPQVLQLDPRQCNHPDNAQIRVYGTDDPLPDNKPTEGSSTSLKYYKKATNFYIPNHWMQWNDITKVGNPTRSDYVNDLIQEVTPHIARNLPSMSRGSGRACTGASRTS